MLAKVTADRQFDLTDQHFAAMRLIINGKPEEIAGGTVLELLRAKSLEPQMVAVELNSKILERDQLATTLLRDGDALELLFYMGGGGR
jgi:sulfur carrier protein